MLCNLKGTLGILRKTQRTYATQPTPLHLAVSGELVNLNLMLEACLQHISTKMKFSHGEYAKCSKGSYNNIPEDAIIIQISDRDILDCILSSLGFENAKFNNTVDNNSMFTCNITLNRRGTSSTTGETVINGEAKKSAVEAESNAAAKAIAFVESVLYTEVVDVNYPTLLLKQELLNRLLAVKKRFEDIQQFVSAEWSTMIDQLKGVVNLQYGICQQMDLDIEDNVLCECSEIMDATVGDIKFMYDFCTICLD